MADKEGSAVRDAVKSGVAAMAIGAAGMVAALVGAYWLVILIVLGVATFLVVLYVRYQMKRFYRLVVWACLELLSLFLVVPSLRAAGVVGEDCRFVVVMDSVGTGGFVALCGLCGVAMIVSAVVDWFKARGERNAGRRGGVGEVKVRGEGIAAVAAGDGGVQEVIVDRSHRQSGGITIGDVGENATVNVTVNNYYYVDGWPEAPNVEARGLFEKGRELSGRGKYREAIEKFERCLRLEADHKKQGALGLQIGNCYYGMRQYVKAGEYYGLGLREARRAGDPEGEGSNLGSIANTFVLRPAGTIASRGENVREAVKHYLAALEIYKKGEYPVDYAMTQNNLGNAYTALPSASTEERAKNVKAAIDCCRAALEIYKKDEYPVQYAATQNSLGAAYTDLPSASTEERAKNVKAAIDCYRAALEIRKKDEYPVKYAMIQNNLGGAYTYLPSASAEERAKNIKAAIDCYRAALEIRKKGEYPVEYAMTQNNLGAAYTDLPSASAEERGKNVKAAIECSRAALEIRRKDEYPVQYAMTQNNLGTAYTALPSASAEERAKNVKAAIDCYRAALEIYKKDKYPQNYCLTAANMGLLLASVGNEDACRWLKEAYSLREYLEDQGKRLEEAMGDVCKE